MMVRKSTSTNPRTPQTPTVTPLSTPTTSRDQKKKPKEEPSPAKPVKVVSENDVGGLKSQMKLLNDLICLPVRNRETVSQLGIHPPRGVLLFGFPGTGKTFAMRAIQNQLGSDVHFVKINGADVFSKNSQETEQKLSNIFSDALKKVPSVIFIDDIDYLCASKRSASEQEKRILSILFSFFDEIQETEVMIVAATNKVDTIDGSLRRPGRFDVEIEFTVPLAKDRVEILNAVMSKVSHNITKESMAKLAESAYSFTGADLTLACRKAALFTMEIAEQKPTQELELQLEKLQLQQPNGDVEEQPEEEEAKQSKRRVVTEDCLKQALKTIKPSAMREIMLEVPPIYWDDIGGMTLVKEKLKQAVVLPLTHPEAFKRLGIAPPKGILLYGPPGCSKTMIGKALATQSQLNFISIKGPELFNKWVGESERAVRELFRKAKQASPAIVFFDEIDALAAERGGNENASAVGDRVLAQLLTEMDGVESLDGVIIVAATNRPDKIDKALLRRGRLGTIIYVPLPDEETRRDILRIKMKTMPIKLDSSSELDDIVLATKGLSGAEITALCEEAALLALNHDLNADKITFQHFKQVLPTIVPRTTQAMINYYESYHSTQTSAEE